MQFDSGYQHDLIRRMTMRSFMERVGGLLHPEMFDQELVEVVQDILTAWRKSHVLTSNQLRQLCARHKVKLSGSAAGDAEFDVDEISRFSWERHWRAALVDVHVHVEKGDTTAAKRAVSQLLNWNATGTTALLPADVIRENVILPNRQGLQSTGIPGLDKALMGGVGAGELAVILAVTGGGKTSFLVHLAHLAVQAKLKVYYVTLEVPTSDIYAKLRCSFCQHPKPPDKLWNKVRKTLKGTWWLEQYEPGAISVDDLDRIIPKDAQAVFVDYADYLRLDSGRPGDDYAGLGAIYNGLKGIALRRKCPVWTATQVNREAYKERADSKSGEDPIILLHHVESSLKKMMIADQAISINQRTVEETPDETTGNCTATLFVAKNRHGPKYGRFPITVNWAKCAFEEGSWS